MHEFDGGICAVNGNDGKRFETRLVKLFDTIFSMTTTNTDGDVVPLCDDDLAKVQEIRDSSKGFILSMHYLYKFMVSSDFLPIGGNNEQRQDEEDEGSQGEHGRSHEKKRLTDGLKAKAGVANSHVFDRRKSKKKNLWVMGQN